MKQIYNFFKVKMCYRTYWKQWLAFFSLTLIIVLFMSSCNDTPANTTQKNDNKLDKKEEVVKPMFEGKEIYSIVGVEGYVSPLDFTDDKKEQVIKYIEDQSEHEHEGLKRDGMGLRITPAVKKGWNEEK